MPIGKELDAHDKFKMALGLYYKTERDRSEACLAQVINILGSADQEYVQIEKILALLTDHYSRAAAVQG